MLKDEIKPALDPVRIDANPMRDVIAEQVKAFLEKGGAIKTDEQSQPKMIVAATKKDHGIHNIDIVPIKNRAKTRARFGHQNIKKCATGHNVKVGSFDCGIFPSLSLAIDARDRKRALLGLPPADY